MKADRCQALLDSRLTIRRVVAVPYPCQNGERIRGSHGHTQTIGTGPDLGRSRSEAGGNDLLSSRSRACTLELAVNYGKELVGAENLCHQAILVNHSSGAVAPEDPEVIQVRDAIGQRSQRRGLGQGAVRPVRIVEVLVLA
jgi:hypothetical protein